jgi:hypothetical protein
MKVEMDIFGGEIQIVKDVSHRSEWAFICCSLPSMRMYTLQTQECNHYHDDTHPSQTQRTDDRSETLKDIETLLRMMSGREKEEPLIVLVRPRTSSLHRRRAKNRLGD